jgi:deoxyribodipyrimidine photo-lyase
LRLHAELRRLGARMSTLLWFRLDLRLEDNPALEAALEAGAPVVPVYLWCPREEGAWAPGAASRWWLHESLERLAEALERCGSRLIVRAGEEAEVTLRELALECGATRLYWNRRYEPALIARDQRVKSALRDQGLEVASYNSALLHEPWTLATKSGGPFQVFGAFWRQCRSLPDPPAPLAAPTRLPAPARWPQSLSLAQLELKPPIDWTQGLRRTWAPGIEGAAHRLQEFLEHAFDRYAGERDIPAAAGTSRLSPHLHFGEIGARQIWHATRRLAEARGRHSSWRDSQFLTELGWREFAHHLLYHFPESPHQPLRARYARFPWNPSAAQQRAWQRGETGYPIVDAGMRELWQTGWMHNRVRMIVASFLVKDLLQPWSEGARWFWDTLVDADLASNTLGWQWVAGSGADAAPFFRIFNPVSQGQKFDPDGRYVRRFLPGLAALPDEWLHQPWAAPAQVLQAAGVVLGTTYPVRLVDHALARQRALAALQSL